MGREGIRVPTQPVAAVYDRRTYIILSVILSLSKSDGSRERTESTTSNHSLPILLIVLILSKNSVNLEKFRNSVISPFPVILSLSKDQFGCLG
jgi:hypothetical protein